MSSELKVVDLFAGVGGLSCGFKKADLRIKQVLVKSSKKSNNDSFSFPI